MTAIVSVDGGPWPAEDRNRDGKWSGQCVCVCVSVCVTAVCAAVRYVSLQKHDEKKHNVTTIRLPAY